MLAAFLILFREGLEAVLIITIIALFLKKMNLTGYFKYLVTGVFLAFALCLALASFIYFTKREFPQSQQELLEGIIGILAVALLTWMIFWMRKHGREIKGEVEGKISTTLKNEENKIGKVLVSMAFFAVIREGVESIVFLFSLDSSKSLYIGGFLGILSAVIAGILLYKGSNKVNLRIFFNITSILIIFFAAGLFAGSFRKLAEAGIFYWQQQPLWNIENVLSNDSIFGTILGAFFGYDAAPARAEVLAYLIYLIPTLSAYVYTNKQPNKPKLSTQQQEQK